MRFLPLLLLTLCMLALVCWIAWEQSSDLLGQIQFQDPYHSQELDLFYDQDQDQYVLFLPGFTNPQDITHSAPSGMQVTYDLTTALESPVELELSTRFHRQTVSLRLMPLSRQTSLFIHSEEGLIDYLNESKDNTRDVVVQFLDADGSTLLQSTASMYGRGNGSWASPSKKPYNLEFSQAVSVGPFQDVTKLCMLAEFSDESRLRNSLAYYAGRELGIDYASPYQFTDVYVNGEYLGLYGLVTKQEYKKHLEEDHIQAVFEIATAHNRVEFDSSLGWRINVIYGSKPYVQQLVNGFESAIAQNDWDATQPYIDIESFALKYALEEFLANLDLSYGSQYFYVDADNKIHCMLPWDYDWTLGSSYQYYNNLQVYELKVHRNTKSWYYLLMDLLPFRVITVSVWQERFDDPFLQKLENHLSSDILHIADSWACEKLRWKYEEPYSIYDVSSGVSELEGFYGLFRDFFYQRRDFLIDCYSNWWNYRYFVFYGARWGNLSLPVEHDAWDYFQNASLLDVNEPNKEFLGWYAGDVSLEEFSPDSQWIEVYGEYETVKEQPDADWWLGLSLVAAFILSALGLFLVFLKSLKKRGVHGRKEKVPTRI